MRKEPDIAVIQAARLKKLFAHMVDIYSPSGKEKTLVDFLYRYLHEDGLPAERQKVEGDRHNVVIWPTEGEAHMVFVGHIDTVPAFDYENYGFEEDGDDILGLGTADMKGGCAAMIEAFLAYYETYGRTPPAVLALVVGEEESGDGTQRLLRELDAEWALIGEPTDLAPCLAHYSYLEMKLLSEGKRRHASLAKRWDNAIHRMLNILLALTDFLDTKHPDIVYNIRDLHSSQSGFAMPDWCEVAVDLHVPPQLTTSDVTAELENVVEQLAEKRPALKPQLSFETIHAGYSLRDKGPLPDLLRATFARHDMPWAPTPFPSHSDANLLWAAGVKPILLGPGRLDKAHTREETVPFGQVQRAAALYLDMLHHLDEAFGEDK